MKTFFKVLGIIILSASSGVGGSIGFDYYMNIKPNRIKLHKIDGCRYIEFPNGDYAHSAKCDGGHY